MLLTHLVRLLCRKNQLRMRDGPGLQGMMNILAWPIGIWFYLSNVTSLYSLVLIKLLCMHCLATLSLQTKNSITKQKKVTVNSRDIGQL
jgi:hypothetical protein